MKRSEWLRFVKAQEKAAAIKTGTVSNPKRRTIDHDSPVDPKGQRKYGEKGGRAYRISIRLPK